MPSVELLPYTTLIVDSDAIIRSSTAEVLSTLCFVQEAGSLEEARALMEMVPVHVLLARDQLPDGDAIGLCTYAKSQSPNTVRILYGHAPLLPRAMAAINIGEVWRYMDAQWDPDRIYRMVKQAIDRYCLRSDQESIIQQLRGANDLLSRKVEQRTRELISISEELRIALDKIQALTVTDDLTGLLNRRNMSEKMLEAFRQAKRYKTALSVLALDIVNFRELNNTYGQETGDAVLQEVGRRLIANIRDVDIACRVGGDDFALIFPHTNCSGARIIAERMHHMLTSIPFHVGSQSFTLSFALGIAELTPSVASAADLYKRAEEAESRARKAGGAMLIGVYPDPENAAMEQPLLLESVV